jgi:adenylate cyclase
VALVSVKHLGYLQFLEFDAYDYLIRHQSKTLTSDPIILVEMTESDIHSPDLDYPLHDDKLAKLLETIAADQPSVIGLDIWRDIPVPKSGVGIQEFNRVLEAHDNIVAIFTLDGIQPPAFLNSNPDRVAFNDNFPPDVDVDSTIPKVRRCTLFAESSNQIYDSLPFRVACVHLQGRGIVPAPDPGDTNSFLLGKARLRKFEPDEGAYVGADNSGWQMLLDFRCPNQFTRFTVVDVLSGRVPAGTFRDKIVLVGVNTPSVSDERVTPIKHSHKGIEVQSQAIHQLLRQAIEGEEGLKSWGDWMEDAWVLLWCALGGGMGYWVRSPWRFTLLALACVASLAATLSMAFEAGWWIPLVAPALAFIASATLVTSYVSFHERKQRGQLMQLFSKQVSPDIAHALWDQRDEFLAGQRPKSQKLTATVLFTDLVGFSTTSERMEPAELMDWLNEFMDAMATTIMAHNGVVEKYIGDAIMAAFGVPLPRTTPEEISHDARNAVRCALAMGVKMEQLNVEWIRRGLPACGMRIGIHTGSLVAGSLGSADRQEYTVLGDSVNTASRLESYDKDWVDEGMPVNRCRILISEATRSLLGPDFNPIKIGTVALKNKDEPVTIYVVRPEASHSGAQSCTSSTQSIS